MNRHNESTQLRVLQQLRRRCIVRDIEVFGQYAIIGIGDRL